MNNRQKLQIGDLIEFRSGLIYRHWAVYIGNGKVSHLPGCNCLKTRCTSEVRHERLKEVAERYRGWRISNKYDNDPRFKKLKKKTIKRMAEKTKGPMLYDLFQQNCEHYALFCRYGESRSFQVEKFVAAIKKFHREMDNIFSQWEKFTDTVAKVLDFFRLENAGFKTWREKLTDL